MMNTRTGFSGAAAAIIFFLIGAGLCPLALDAKPKRTAPKQEAPKEEKAVAVNEPAAGSDAGGDTDAPPAVKEEARQEATEGIPTKDFKEDDFRPRVEEESSAWMFFKMLFVLAIFGGGFYYFYRFVTKKAGITMFGGEAVRVLSVIPVGQNKFLQLVDVAGRLLLVGVSDSSINLITEITEKDQVDRIRILATRTPPPAKGAGGFQDMVMKDIGRLIDRVRGFGRRDRRAHDAREAPQDIEYLRRQRGRLRDLNGDDHE